jgi:hypothetical protein
MFGIFHEVFYCPFLLAYIWLFPHGTLLVVAGTAVFGWQTRVCVNEYFYFFACMLDDAISEIFYFVVSLPKV